MAASVVGIVDAFDKRRRVRLSTCQQSFKIFCTGQVFVSSSFADLTCDHKGNFMYPKLANVCDRCAGHDKTCCQYGAGIDASHDSLCTCARTLDDDFSIEFKLL